MKVFLQLLLLSILFLNNPVFSAKPILDSIPPPIVYLGGGIGINDMGLLGMCAELPITKSVALGLNLGIGGWGGKVGGEINYYFPTVKNGSAISIGYMYASGNDSIPMDITTKSDDSPKSVVLDFNPQSTINIKYSYSMGIGRSKSSKLVFSIGYAAPLRSNFYSVQNENLELSDNSESSIKLYEPGGVIFGAKFMFGIGTRKKN